MVDIYATLAELIEYDLGTFSSEILIIWIPHFFRRISFVETKKDCNEAPDSRSLVQYLETGEPSEEVQRKPIMTHANIRGVNASLRKKEFKYVPGTRELYNLSFDPATEHVFLFCREIIFNYF